MLLTAFVCVARAQQVKKHTTKPAGSQYSQFGKLLPAKRY